MRASAAQGPGVRGAGSRAASWRQTRLQPRLGLFVSPIPRHSLSQLLDVVACACHVLEDPLRRLAQGNAFTRRVDHTMTAGAEAHAGPTGRPTGPQLARCSWFAISTAATPLRTSFAV